MPAAAILNDPVAKHVRTGAATLRPGWTVADALAHLRADPPAGRIIYFYVTDEAGKLVGVVPTRRLLLSAPDARIDGVMIRGVVAVPADATVLEACEFFTLHRLLAFPVGDGEGVRQHQRFVGEARAQKIRLPDIEEDFPVARLIEKAAGHIQRKRHFPGGRL